MEDTERSNMFSKWVERIRNKVFPGQKLRRKWRETFLQLVSTDLKMKLVIGFLIVLNGTQWIIDHNIEFALICFQTWHHICILITGLRLNVCYLDKLLQTTFLSSPDCNEAFQLGMQLKQGENCGNVTPGLGRCIFLFGFNTFEKQLFNSPKSCPFCNDLTQNETQTGAGIVNSAGQRNNDMITDAVLNLNIHISLFMSVGKQGRASVFVYKAPQLCMCAWHPRLCSLSMRACVRACVEGVEPPSGNDAFRSCHFKRSHPSISAGVRCSPLPHSNPLPHLHIYISNARSASPCLGREMTIKKFKQMLTHVFALTPKQLWLRHKHLSQNVLRNCPPDLIKRKINMQKGH